MIAQKAAGFLFAFTLTFCHFSFLSGLDDVRQVMTFCTFLRGVQPKPRNLSSSYCWSMDSVFVLKSENDSREIWGNMLTFGILMDYSVNV